MTTEAYRKHGQEIFFNLGVNANALPVRDNGALRFIQGVLIGQGGMAKVSLGFDWVEGRIVALKHTSPDKDDLHNESAFMARTHDGHIPGFIDFIERAASGLDQDYLAIEHIQGHTLKAILQTRGPLLLAETVNILDQVAQTIDRAHKKDGTLHRDLKPENLIIAPSGHTTVIDWGIATTVYTKPDDIFVGEWRYATPESFTSQGITTPRSDVFNLGTLFHEMITGSWPYGLYPVDPNEKNAEKLRIQKAITRKVICEWPALPLENNEKVRQTYPPSIIKKLQTIQDRALDKNEEKRYATPIEYMDALKENSK